MATREFIGNAPSVAQVDTYTVGGTIVAGNTITLTINGKAYTFTATTGVLADAANGLYLLVAASTEPEFKEITWAYTASNAFFTGTSKVAGRPFTATATKAQGGGGSDLHTFTKAATTASSGPNHAGIAANWSGATLPVSNDTVRLRGTFEILYDLDALTALTSGTIFDAKEFHGKLGLPDANPSGYSEYRLKYFVLASTSINIGGIHTRFRYDNNSASSAAITVWGSGAPTDTNVDRTIHLKGMTGNAQITVNGGSSIQVADLPTETASLLTLLAGSAGSTRIRVGTGVTGLATVTTDGAETESKVAVTTVTVNAGKHTQTSGAVMTVKNRAYYVNNSSGALTAYDGSGSDTLDCEQTAYIGKPITQATIRRGSKIWDQFKTVTWSGSPHIVLDECGIEEVNLRLGKDIGLTRS